MTDTKVQIGDIYRWAGKRWRVTSVDTASGTAKIENTDAPENTARMPLAQFREASRESWLADHRSADGTYDREVWGDV